MAQGSVAVREAKSLWFNDVSNQPINPPKLLFIATVKGCLNSLSQGSIISVLTLEQQQVIGPNIQRFCQGHYCIECWTAATVFQSAHVLSVCVSAFGHPFLCQTSPPA